jgi:hypothetical protein
LHNSGGVHALFGAEQIRLLGTSFLVVESVLLAIARRLVACVCVFPEGPSGKTTVCHAGKTSSFKVRLCALCAAFEQTIQINWNISDRKICHRRDYDDEWVGTSFVRLETVTNEC